MQFTQIRNATLKLNYAEKILIDAWLAEKGAIPRFDGTINDHIRNPTADLPMPINKIIDVDIVILIHDHSGHWDETAKNTIPQDMLFFVQHKKDAQSIQSAGFTNIPVLEDNNIFEDITIIKTPGRHEGSKVVEDMRNLLGKLKHPNEKIIYTAGDTVWYEEVEENLKKYHPDVVVLNSCDTQNGERPFRASI